VEPTKVTPERVSPEGVSKALKFPTGAIPSKPKELTPVAEATQAILLLNCVGGACAEAGLGVNKVNKSAAKAHSAAGRTGTGKGIVRDVLRGIVPESTEFLPRFTLLVPALPPVLALEQRRVSKIECNSRAKPGRSTRKEHPVIRGAHRIACDESDKLWLGKPRELRLPFPSCNPLACLLYSRSKILLRITGALRCV
jgi:hypothetical protein